MGQFLQELFLNIFNMSITASYAILFVLLARLFLKKAPKIFSYSLWAVVLFRLVCPVSFSSALSFFGFLKIDSMEHISANIGVMVQPQVDPQIGDMGQAVSSSLPAANPSVSVNFMQIILFNISILWALGILSLLIYSVVSYRLLKRKVSTAMLLKGNIFECEKIQTPFVLGIIAPKIYLPMGFSETEKSYILKHEQTHISRFDYILKPFAFLVLCIHWFNPLVWVSFIVMNKDMEMSCDERVLKEMGTDIKKDYSSSLLSLAVGRKMISGSTLAFGVSSTKNRIKNVLNYKQPTFWVVLLAITAITAISIGLMTNPKRNEPDLSFLNIGNTASAALQKESLIIRSQGHGATAIAGNKVGKWLDEASNSWKEMHVASPYELAPTLTIYINDSGRHEVRFYESEPELAMVLYESKYRYYKMPKEDYNKIFMMYAASSYFIPEEVIQAITSGKRTNKQSVQDIPQEVNYKVIKAGNESYYLYEKGGEYYCEQPYQFISKIPEDIYKSAIEFADTPISERNQEFSSEIAALVETRLTVIMSSPLALSNPEDYIKTNAKAYEEILKYGGEEALSYMLSQFEKGNGGGLRGQIMMRLCKEFLGERNNVSDEILSPMEWFRQLTIRRKVDLPDFVYSGDDPIKKLVYETEVQKHKGSRGEFTVVAPHIFGSYEEDNKLKIFVTTFGNHYVLYDKTLAEEGGGIIPAVITYVKNPDGSYLLEKYEQAEDGSYFASSIKKYCVMPVSGKKISGLPDKILAHYSNYKDIIKLERENLIEHLKANSQYGVSIYQKNYQKPAELIPIT